MNHSTRNLAIVAIIAIATFGLVATEVRADHDGRSAYAITPLVANLTGAGAQNSQKEKGNGVSVI